ncbi:PREDICTED: cell death regulator Aven [Bison bison bison]|uniref:Cell death regulator Aven n=1 Tax=Bison bison bison TaxID=43346 RepID=A0A6P3HVB2_BISBB|nr:PREDICTED: cell death regulator Aven [Bison bison bison]
MGSVEEVERAAASTSSSRTTGKTHQGRAGDDVCSSTLWTGYLKTWKSKEELTGGPGGENLGRPVRGEQYCEFNLCFLHKRKTHTAGGDQDKVEFSVALHFYEAERVSHLQEEAQALVFNAIHRIFAFEISKYYVEVVIRILWTLREPTDRACVLFRCFLRTSLVAQKIEDDSDAETYGEENEEQGNYSKRKIVSNWDRYQDTEKEVDNESGESQRGTDFSVLLSSAGDSFSQFRFAEEKEWDGEASCPKQNSAFYVDCESLVRALQELPLSLRLNVAAELVQTALPLELPQVKPKRNNDGKGLGMQLKGPSGPGGKGSLSEMTSTTTGFPVYPGKDGPGSGPSKGSRNPTSLLQLAADHLEEELDLLLNLDAPVKEGGDILSDQTAQDLESEKRGELVQAAAEPANPFVLEEKNVTSGQPSISRNVTEEELEDWLDSMIS